MRWNRERLGKTRCGNEADFCPKRACDLIQRNTQLSFISHREDHRIDIMPESVDRGFAQKAGARGIYLSCWQEILRYPCADGIF